MSEAVVLVQNVPIGKNPQSQRTKSASNSRRHRSVFRKHPVTRAQKSTRQCSGEEALSRKPAKGKDRTLEPFYIDEAIPLNYY